MTKREDLRKQFLAVAELGLMKVEEIRELLSQSRLPPPVMRAGGQLQALRSTRPI
jgi:hypothetical protein